MWLLHSATENACYITLYWNGPSVRKQPQYTFLTHINPTDYHVKKTAEGSNQLEAYQICNTDLNGHKTVGQGDSSVPQRCCQLSIHHWPSMHILNAISHSNIVISHFNCCCWWLEQLRYLLRCIWSILMYTNNTVTNSFARCCSSTNWIRCIAPLTTHEAACI